MEIRHGGIQGGFAQICRREMGFTKLRSFARRFSASEGRKVPSFTRKRVGRYERAFFVVLNKVICQLQENMHKIDKDKIDQDELVVNHKEEKKLRIALLRWNAFVIIVTVMVWCNGARVEHYKILPKV